MSNCDPSRRSFLKYGFFAGSFCLVAPALDAQVHFLDNEVGEQPDLYPLLKIHGDNSLTFYSPSPDMGQGIDVALAQLFIEELGGDFSRVKTEPAPLGLKLDDEGQVTWKSVPQGAGGSTSISRNWRRLRVAGATTKQLFLKAAAQKFSVPMEALEAKTSYIISGKDRFSFASLAQLAAEQTLDSDFTPSLTPKADWRIIGKAQKQKVAKQIVTGQPLYAMDMEYPNSKIATIVRCPYLDGFVESVDDDVALAIKGVSGTHIIDRPNLEQNYTHLAAGVAVVADTVWAAFKARRALKIVWNKGPHRDESTERLDKQCDELLSGQGQIIRDDGNFVRAVDQAESVLKRRYRMPTVSHAQLEPQNCIADIRSDSATIIAPMQSPQGASRLVSDLTGLDRLSIDIQYPRLGGGFGRRLTNDHVAEAVLVSQAHGGPVKLLWTREDDLAHDFYRPMGHHEMIAAFDDKNTVVAWSHRLAGTPKYFRRGRPADEIFSADLYVDDFPAGLVENLRHEYFAAKSGLPQGSWRAPAHTANAFVVESFVDEIAEHLNQSPLDLRLRMLGAPRELPYGQHGGPIFDTGRHAGVLKKVAEMADFGRKLSSNRGLGLAAHFTFGGYCAQIAEVELAENRSFKVRKIWCAIDIGQIVNPAGVRAQAEGGINDGLSAVREQEIRVTGGAVVSRNFDSYFMMRMADSVPEIDVDVIHSDKDPSGMGEMALPPTAAAVANGIRRAGGDRLRNTPLINPAYSAY